jgi:hypothetical protein
MQHAFWEPTYKDLIGNQKGKDQLGTLRVYGKT